MKKCRKCNLEKPVTDFHSDRRARDGKCGRCKQCALAATRDWAIAHRKPQYLKRQRLGFPARKARAEPVLGQEDRFLALVKISDGCWEWQGAKGRFGYGAHKWGPRKSRKNLAAHRIAYTLAFGPVPDGLHVLHSCDNPKCVFPGHLRAGTHDENMRDKAIRGRVNAEGSRGTRNWNAKLSEDQVRDIRRTFATGSKTKIELARAYGVGRDTIRELLAGRSYCNVL